MISIHKKVWRGESAIKNGFNDVRSTDFDSVAAARLTRHVWSPHVWIDGTRNNSNWLSCAHLALDFDNGKMTLTEAYDEFGDFWHIIGPTKSHMIEKKGEPPCDRFRVVLLFDRIIQDPKEYALVYLAAMHVWPIDTACKDLSHFFYPCTKITSTHLFEKGFEPLLFPVDILLEIGTKLERKSGQKKQIKLTKAPTDDWGQPVVRYKLPKWVYDILMTGFDQKTRIKLNNGTYIEGRNNISYALARNLRREGDDFEKTMEKIGHSIGDWTDFSPEELKRTVESAYKGEME